eukprot:4905148-Pyramimonas_sp.AAC.1
MIDTVRACLHVLQRLRNERVLFLLAQENGIFLRPPANEDTDEDDPQWVCTTESLNMDWLESVQLVSGSVALSLPRPLFARCGPSPPSPLGPLAR